MEALSSEHVFLPKSVGKMSPQVVESENDPIFWWGLALDSMS